MYTDDLLPAAALRAVPLGRPVARRWRAGDHPGPRLRLGSSSDWTGRRRRDRRPSSVLLTAWRSASPCARGTALADRELEQVKLRRARAAGARAARHRRPPRLGDRHPGPGRARVAATDPTPPSSALEVIEEEASRTLAEMRAMVRVLRDQAPADSRPQPGRRRHRAARPRRRRPGRGSRWSSPATSTPCRRRSDAAIYRIAQESVTNALRHARNATRVDVRVAGDDDWRPAERPRRRRRRAQPRRARPGYGIVGMTERADAARRHVLEAGPRPGRRLDGRGAPCRGRCRHDDHPRARRRRPGARPHRAAA